MYFSVYILRIIVVFNVLLTGADLTEVFTAEGRGMEEEIRMAETEQADGVSNEAEPSVNASNNSPIKRGRGRPQGSKKLKVCVTDVNLMELVSGISNGGPPPPQRGRGRPKLSSTKETVRSGDGQAENSHRGKGRPRGSKKVDSNGGCPTSDLAPRKRGRPKKSLSQSTDQKVAAADLPNGGSSTPKAGRGRPKGSTKRKLESLREDVGSPATPRKRGRPKGSLNKKRRLEVEVSSEGEAETEGSISNGITNTLQRGRGRPRKYFDNRKRNQKSLAGSSGTIKRGRGRPKGSLNKKCPAFKLVQHGTVSRPRRVHVSPPKERPGRPKKTAKRGRPRKYPLPPPEDRHKKPKVWKPLGRPRKYPRVDPPEGTLPAPVRRPGRPRKSESKRGAHLRKNMPASPSAHPNDGVPRKRGRPPGTTKSADVTPRKRGRPKGSLNKNKADRATQLDSALSNHSKLKSEPSAVLLLEGEPIEEEMEDDTQTTTTTTNAANAEETVIEEDATFEVSNQA